MTIERPIKHRGCSIVRTLLGGGGGVLPHIGYAVCAAEKGMVFKPSTLG